MNISKLNSLRSSTSITPEKLERVNLNRALASSTLKKKRELERWDEANKYLYSILGAELNFNLISELNGVLTSNSGLRKTEVYGAGLKYLKKEHLEKEIQNFNSLLTMRESLHPLEFALKIYIWIVSVHPFKNGNGRTARLITDKILLENNYLPLCFADSRSGHCAYFDELQNNNLASKIMTFFKGLTRGYSL